MMRLDPKARPNAFGVWPGTFRFIRNLLTHQAIIKY